MENRKRKNRRIPSDYFRINLLKKLIHKKEILREDLMLEEAMAEFFKDIFGIPPTIDEIKEKSIDKENQNNNQVAANPQARGQKRKIETIMSPIVKKCKRSLHF